MKLVKLKAKFSTYRSQITVVLARIQVNHILAETVSVFSHGDAVCCSFRLSKKSLTFVRFIWRGKKVDLSQLRRSTSRDFVARARSKKAHKNEARSARQTREVEKARSARQTREVDL